MARGQNLKRTPAQQARMERGLRLLELGLTTEEVGHHLGITGRAVRKWPTSSIDVRIRVATGSGGTSTPSKKDYKGTSRERYGLPVLRGEVTEDEAWAQKQADEREALASQSNILDGMTRNSDGLAQIIQYASLVLLSGPGRARVQRDFSNELSAIPFKVTKAAIKQAAANMTALAKEWKD